MATIEEINPANRLGSKLRDGLALAQTRIHTIEEQARSQWESLPMQARAAIERLATRIRVGLDLPSRSELVGLVERIDELDQKLEALARRQRAALKAPAAAQPASGDEAPPVQAATTGDSTVTETVQAKPAKADDAPPRNRARTSKLDATRTKKARSNSASKTISAPGAKKSAAAGKRQAKGQAKGKPGQAGKRD